MGAGTRWGHALGGLPEWMPGKGPMQAVLPEAGGWTAWPLAPSLSNYLGGSNPRKPGIAWGCLLAGESGQL